LDFGLSPLMPKLLRHSLFSIKVIKYLSLLTSRPFRFPQLISTMKVLTSHTFIAMTLVKSIRAFSSVPCNILKSHGPVAHAPCPVNRNTSFARKFGTVRYMSTDNSFTIRQVDKQSLHEIIEDIESTSREESGYVVIGE
jgi:hypothetical protein